MTRTKETDDAANLQSMTAKQAAAHFGMSERQLHKCFGFIARWRPDLMKKVAAGEMTVHAAYRETRGEAKPQVGPPRHGMGHRHL